MSQIKEGVDDICKLFEGGKSCLLNAIEYMLTIVSCSTSQEIKAKSSERPIFSSRARLVFKEQLQPSAKGLYKLASGTNSAPSTGLHQSKYPYMGQKPLILRRIVHRSLPGIHRCQYPSGSISPQAILRLSMRLLIRCTCPQRGQRSGPGSYPT